MSTHNEGAPPERLLTPQQVAAALGITPGALKTLRHRGTGPLFVRVTPRRVMYRPSDLEAYLETQTYGCTTTAEPHPQERTP